MDNTNFIGYRPTWAEVRLDNLSYNLAQIKKRLSAKIKVMGTVKADAYGHGLIPVAKKLVDYGVDYLGVASIDEGIKLREAGINLPVLVLGLILETDIEPLFTYGLTVTVCTESFARVLNIKAKSLGRIINAHIKVDTGMGRIGVLYREALRTIKKIHSLKFINIEGVFTHFALADVNEEFTFTQISFFGRLVAKLHEDNIHIPLVHAANSSGIFNFEESHFNMVRPGLVIYGLSPGKNTGIDLKPLLSLKTKIVYVKKVPQGYGISYGHTYVTSKPTTIVTLPIGYGDGYPRNLSNQASVLIKGKYFKISGRVCMDQIMVDVGNTSVKAGDEAVLIGSQGKNKIIVEDLADLSGTIPYEIVCGLGSRIPRIYI